MKTHSAKTLVRDTSLAAYDSIKPTLEPREKAVLALFGPGVELCNRQIGLLLHWPINCVTGRTHRLRKMKPPKLVDAGVKKGAEGRSVHFWKRTGE